MDDNMYIIEFIKWWWNDNLRDFERDMFRMISIVVSIFLAASLSMITSIVWFFLGCLLFWGVIGISYGIYHLIKYINNKFNEWRQLVINRLAGDE